MANIESVSPEAAIEVKKNLDEIWQSIVGDDADAMPTSLAPAKDKGRPYFRFEVKDAYSGIEEGTTLTPQEAGSSETARKRLLELWGNILKKQARQQSRRLGELLKHAGED